MYCIKLLSGKKEMNYNNKKFLNFCINKLNKKNQLWGGLECAIYLGNNLFFTKYFFNDNFLINNRCGVE